MRRWLLFSLVLLVIFSGIAVVAVRVYVAYHPVRVRSPSLARVPNSAYKYMLCEEAFAYSPAYQNSPYGTDDSFQDPFRHVKDTITPHFLGFDWRNSSVSFSIDLMIGQVATYHQTITHVQSLDGIAVLLPDNQNRLQHTSIPQFIVSSIQGAGADSMAVIDYTCPEQWVWHIISA